MPMPDWFDPSMLMGAGGMGGMAPPPGLLNQPQPGAPPIPQAPQLPGASPAAAQAAGAPLTDPQRAAAMQQLANGIRGAFPTPQPNPNAPPPGGSMMAPRPGGLPYGPGPQGGPMAANQMNPAMQMGIGGAGYGPGQMAGQMNQMPPAYLQNMLSGLGGQGLAGSQNLMGSIMGGLGQQRPPLTAGPMGGGRPYF